jgi:hypothetical protein
LDCGLELYLFIAKSCDAALLQKVFGKSKFGKNETITEECIQENVVGEQVRTLVSFLRQYPICYSDRNRACGLRCRSFDAGRVLQLNVIST